MAEGLGDTCLAQEPLKHISRHFWAYEATYYGGNSHKFYSVKFVPDPHLRQCNNDYWVPGMTIYSSVKIKQEYQNVHH